MTAVWGAGWIAEVALKVLIVFSLSIPQALVVGPIESAVITVLLILWTIWYTRAVLRRRAEAAPTSVGANPRSL
jgi:hypothetical protein